MRNPFQSEPLHPESEADAGTLFSELSSEELSPSASASIRGSMLNALSATRSAVGHSGRFALASSAVMLPLLAIGAVGAASGESPVTAPVSLVQSAATTLGIVSAEAPEANQETSTLAVAAETAGSTTAPSTNLAATAGGPSSNLAGAIEAQEGEEGDEEEGGAAEAAIAAHEDGNGCDDILFGAGDPPFATPGGPVGCEVGNSADHRQNGANHEDDEDDGEEDAAEDTSEEDEDTGGPADAAVAAHEDGNGCDDVLFGAGEPPFATPGGPVGCEVGNSADHRQNGVNHQDEEDDGEGGEEALPEEPAVEPAGAATGPGNSGTAPGQENRGGRKN